MVSFGWAGWGGGLRPPVLVFKFHFAEAATAHGCFIQAQFFELRETPGLKKKPSTSEVLDWLKLILSEDLGPEDLRREGKHSLPRLHGALLKNEQDVQLFERLAFLSRSGRG